jgi:hypothetical protein
MLGDVASTVASHAANAIKAPIMAVGAPPQTTAEKFAALLGPAGLAGYRMIGKPSADALAKVPQDWKQRDKSQSFGNALLKKEPAYVKDVLDAVPVVGPWASSIENDAREHGGVAALGGLATDILAPKAAGAVIGAGARALAPAARLAETIPGDTVNPYQRFRDAQARGVNLDRAQATGAPIATSLKTGSEHSMGGKGAFEANHAANVKALDAWANDLQAPQANGQPAPLMSREQFGNSAKGALAEHQRTLNQQAGHIFDDLTERVGHTNPDTTPVTDLAKKIVVENQDYYNEHPELLNKGTGSAWKIVNDLARTEGTPASTVKSGVLDSSGNPLSREVPATPRVQPTWADLHKLRSDLMDQYRSPDLVGSRAEGWLKQLVGGVDDSMAGASSNLSGADLAEFRRANDIYRQMKESYDSPQHPFYSIVRSPDGLTAANTLSGLKPQVARQFSQAVTEAGKPELAGQHQQQAISRLLDPNGDGTFDLKNLPSRLNRQNMEQLQGVLTPEQVTDLQGLSRTAKLIHADENPSGTAKKGQVFGELAAGASGLSTGLTTAAFGHPLVGAGEALATPAWLAGTKLAAKALTSPSLTERAFEPGPNADAANATATNAGRAAAIGGDIQYSPDSHHFSPSQWQTANPDADVQGAIDEAQKQGYEVVD